MEFSFSLVLGHEFNLFDKIEQIKDEIAEGGS
jgi:hypothetical protein